MLTMGIGYGARSRVVLLGPQGRTRTSDWSSVNERVPERPPHCALVAFYFPPARASGVFRARALANHLAASGWRVTVLTTQTGFFEDVLQQADRGLLDAIDPGVEIVRVPFPDPRFDRRLRFHGWFRGNFPRWAERRMERCAQRRFPDPYALWIDPAVSALRARHEQMPIDVLVASGNPFSSFEIVREVSQRTAVPYVLDYRDAWTLDQFTETEAYPHGSPVWDAERQTIEAAARVVYVNATQKEWYAERYPSSQRRMAVIENGFDPELLGATGDVKPAGAALRFGYVGTITRHLPWSELVAGWRLVRDRPELQEAEIDLFGHLGFFSHSKDGIAALLPSDENTERVNYRGPLPKGQVGDAYRALDVLLLVTPSSRYVTCQKVYEYMAFGKPIVSINQPQTDARTPLRGYPLSFAVDDLEPEQVAEALLAAAAAARAPDADAVQASKDHAAHFTRERRMAEFETLLEEVVDG